MIFSQAAFERWANGRPRRGLLITNWIFGLALLLLFAAVGGLLPKLLGEGRLLWRGTETTATVRNAELREQSRSTTGIQRYNLTVTYDFVAADARRYEGTARRNDLSTPVR